MSNNPKSILICGESGHGKSASLQDIADRTDVLYFNCESGKPLPFKHSFKEVVITDPEDMVDYLEELIELGDENPYKLIIVDTISFLMDLYETVHVIGSANTQAAWGAYGQFFPRLMNLTAQLDAFFIFFGHLTDTLDEEEGIIRYSVPVKGAIAKRGIESRFTTVIYVKKMSVKNIEKGVWAGNSMLNISDKERNKGYKHVFLTDTDKHTIGGRIRAPLGMFKDEELYIDNNIVPVIKRLIEYYGN